ncbi:unnamed protein product, partial [Didymodactylos carnosus]
NQWPSPSSNRSVKSETDSDSETEFNVSGEDSNEIEDQDNKVKNTRPFFRIRKPYIFKFLKLNSSEWPFILFGTLASLLSGGVEPSIAWVYSIIYGLLAEPNLEKQASGTRNFALVILAIYICGGILQLISTIMFAISGEKLTMRIRSLSFRALLLKNISWFDMPSNNVGLLVTQLSSDASAFKGLTGIRIGMIVQACGAILTALVVSFQAGWKLSFVMLCFAPLLIFSGLLQGKVDSRQSKAANVYANEGGKYANDAVQEIRTIAALQQETFFIQKYEQAFNKNFRKNISKIQFRPIGKAIANSLLYFIHVAVFIYGSKLVENGEMEFANVFRVFIVIHFASTATGRSIAMMPDYSKAKLATRRITRLVKGKSVIDLNDDIGGIKL